jgi:hypothetical protein
VKRASRLCAYCCQPGANSQDHVIAKQFFPYGARDQVYADLPQVSSCTKCNNEKKNQVETSPAVLLQFGDGGETSGRVLTEEVPKRLANNRRLHTSLRRGLQEVPVRRPSGIIVSNPAIYLSPREQSDCYYWLQFVTRGLYCYEFHVPLPVDHTIHLFWHKDNCFRMFYNLLGRTPNCQIRSCAGGEIRYMFALNPIEEMSLWFYAFKSIQVLALTVSWAIPARTKAFIAEVEWPPPDKP